MELSSVHLPPGWPFAAGRSSSSLRYEQKATPCASHTFGAVGLGSECKVGGGGGAGVQVQVSQEAQSFISTVAYALKHHRVRSEQARM